MKKINAEASIDRIEQTLLSIKADAEKGKLKHGDDVHPFFRVHSDSLVDPRMVNMGLTAKDLASLLIARLSAQGYTLLFDEALARETFNDALARLGGMLPGQ